MRWAIIVSHAGTRSTPALPYFIPAPLPSLFFIGTFGAFIRMRAPARTRRAMFDIGAAGPWAGFIVAMIAVVVGLHLSTVTPLDNSSGGLQLGNSLIFWSISRVVLGVNPNDVNVGLHPIAFAGWLGLFVTTLNLLPVGQLDGGHVVYSLFGGRWHRFISRIFAVGLPPDGARAARSCTSSSGTAGACGSCSYLFLGLGHPSTIDSATPLTGRAPLISLGHGPLFILTFSPVPISIVPPQDQPLPPAAGQSYSVMHRLPSAHALSHRHSGLHI